MDVAGNKGARIEISAIKVAAPEVACKVIDRAIQVHGGGGVSDDFPLAAMYAHARTLRLADGPDEVHKLSIARRELAQVRSRSESRCRPRQPWPMPKVLYEKRDRIAYVTLNRPEARNAVDPAMHQMLWETWEDFRDDDSVDVAIVTGAGEAFCAGADLKTYIPPIIEESTPRWVRDNVADGPRRADARAAPHLQAGDRRGQRLGAGGRLRDGAGVRHPDRLRARDVRLVRGAARLPPRRRRDRAAGEHVRQRASRSRCS